MAFLSLQSSNPRFHFDEVFSCIQKSIRRGDEELVTEMCKCFRAYPNVLRKRLIYVAVEDCPDFKLIYDIYLTASKDKSLSNDDQIAHSICTVPMQTAEEQDWL